MTDCIHTKIIYKMEFLTSARHRKPHSTMYYAIEEHTRWGLCDPLCKVSIVRVSASSHEYDSAVNNSKVDSEKN